MKLDRYTQKAQEAILAAQRLATGAKSPCSTSSTSWRRCSTTPRASPS